jgi:purine-nucleoside phosphorylase
MKIKNNDAKREDFDEKIFICDDPEYAKYIYSIPVEMNSDLRSKIMHEKKIKLNMICMKRKSN